MGTGHTSMRKHRWFSKHDRPTLWVTWKPLGGFGSVTWAGPAHVADPRLPMVCGRNLLYPTRLIHDQKLEAKAHEEEHDTVGDYVKSMIFGGLDGILTSFAIVAGAAGERERGRAGLCGGVHMVGKTLGSPAWGTWRSHQKGGQEGLMGGSREMRDGHWADLVAPPVPWFLSMPTAS